MLTPYKKNIRVLLIEPALQRPSFDRPKPNGNLGPAYIIAALRRHGVEVDYLDATVSSKVLGKDSGSDIRQGKRTLLVIEALNRASKSDCKSLLTILDTDDNKDADIAEEIAALTRNQILVQSATAMVGQANMIPQSILQLLA